MSEILLQDLWNAAEASVVDPLNATIATKTAENAVQAATIASQAADVAAKAGQISGLQAELAALHPVPSQFNTGVRGVLTSFPAGVGTAHDITYENRSSSSSNGVTLTGANLTLKNSKFTSTGTSGLNVQNAAGFTFIDGAVDKKVTGQGTFKRCNLASLELTGPSTVEDCYVPGGITGAGVASSTITNTTVTP